MIPVERNFLELRDIKKLKFNSSKENKFLIKKIKPDFQLNKFLYYLTLNHIKDVNIPFHWNSFF